MQSSKTGWALAGLATIGMFVSGCASDGSLSADGKKLLGAGLGALTGYAVCQASGANDRECAALIVAGGVAGYMIAKKLLPEDKPPRNAAVASLLDGSRPTAAWNSTRTGNSGNIRLLAVTTDAKGQPCKKVKEQYNRSGELIEETYTMCKGPNGWETR
jgi:hypothetical protein